MAQSAITRRKLRDKFNAFERTALNLIDEILVYDPKKRVSANSALCRAYLRNARQPQDLKPLLIDSAHEWEVRKCCNCCVSKLMTNVMYASSGQPWIMRGDPPQNSPHPGCPLGPNCRPDHGADGVDGADGTSCSPGTDEPGGARERPAAGALGWHDGT